MGGLSKAFLLALVFILLFAITTQAHHVGDLDMMMDSANDHIPMQTVGHDEDSEEDGVWYVLKELWHTISGEH